MKKNILIVAGETSGDMHAANLIANLKKLKPGLFFFGIGGPRMESEGVNLLERMEHLSIIGVSEVFRKIGHVHRAYKKVMHKVRGISTDLAILIDYPGFNLALAKSLKKRKIPVIYYITPQVWAWGKQRIRLIKKYVDKAIVIFKFEEELFRKYGIDAMFVGHPLLDRERGESPLDKKSLELEEKKLTIALLPGSRESEVKNMLPVMIKAAGLILKQKDAQFVLLKSSGVGEDIYGKILKKSNLRIPSVKDNTYACLGLSDFVFTSSGTATLESAIMARPMLITYRTSFLTALLFKIFARTRFVGLVNIIAGRRVAPEILQYDATPERLAREILSLTSSKEEMEKQVNSLRWVKQTLGAPGASLRAARVIESFLTSLQ
jgi:lipid-A-disaccharide synthase